jgi:hypothetical protein
MKISNWVNGQMLSPTDNPAFYTFFCKEFYHAFKHLPQTLLQQIWNIDYHAESTILKTNIEDTQIIPWVVNDQPLGFIAFQEDLPEKFKQYSIFGFNRPELDNKTLEVLTLFRTGIKPDVSVSLKKDFLDQVCSEMVRAKGYETVLATCTEKALGLYLRWGFHVIAQVEILGIQRFQIIREI